MYFFGVHEVKNPNLSTKRNFYKFFSSKVAWTSLEACRLYYCSLLTVIKLNTVLKISVINKSICQRKIRVVHNDFCRKYMCFCLQVRRQESTMTILTMPAVLEPNMCLLIAWSSRTTKETPRPSSTSTSPGR